MGKQVELLGQGDRKETLEKGVACDRVLGVGHLWRVVAHYDHWYVVALQGLFALLSEGHHTPVEEAVEPLQGLGILGFVQYRHVV